MRLLTRLILAVFICCAARTAHADALADLREMPVLQDGRIKPFDTVARSAIRSVCNRESLEGLDPTQLALEWAARPWDWEDRPILYIGAPELRMALHLTPTTAYISPGNIRANDELQRVAASTEPLSRGASDLRDRLATYDLASSGRLYAMVPGANPIDNWIPLPDARDELSRPWRAALRAWAAGDRAAASAAFADLRIRLWKGSGGDTPHPAYDPAALKREVLYNRLEPFRAAAWAYGVALLVLLGALFWPVRLLRALGLALLTIAVVLNLAGFAARCSITGWAPVTNLYETVVWVAAVAATISLVLSLVAVARRASGQPLTAAACGAAVGLTAAMVGSALPPDYGASFRPLPLALRTNFWLSLHVLTIVSSYGALTLSMVAANVVLVQLLRSRKNPLRRSIASNIRLVDRSVQIGVTLAIAGTLLGGLWADMAWGRFWGWDPKEVWALIIILAYLTLLHVRFTGRIGDVGMAAGAAACFATVLMSWYGVNFILAAGMHSYGFEPGAAGAYLVSGYLVLQFAFAGYVMYLHRLDAREPATNQPMNQLAAAQS